MEFSISDKDDTGDILDDDLLGEDLLEDDLLGEDLLEDDLEIEEYDSTDTLANDLLEATDPEADVGFDIKALDPDDVDFDDVDEIEDKDLSENDDQLEVDDVDDIIQDEEEDEYELEEDLDQGANTLSIKDRILEFFDKFKKPKNTSEEDEDLDDLDDEELDGEELPEGTASFAAKADSTLKTALHKLPALGKLLNKNKEKVAAVDAEGAELEELDLDEDAPVQRKKFKLTPIQIVAVVLGIVFFLFIDEDEPVKPAPAPIVKTQTKPTKSPEEVIRENNIKKQAAAKKEAEIEKAKEVIAAEKPEVAQENPEANDNEKVAKDNSVDKEEIETAEDVAEKDSEEADVTEKDSEEADVTEKDSEEADVAEKDSEEADVAEKDSEGEELAQTNEKEPEVAKENDEEEKTIEDIDAEANVAEELKKIDESTNADLEDLKAENQPPVKIDEDLAKTTVEANIEEVKKVENIADSDLDEIDLTQNPTVSDTQVRPEDTQEDKEATVSDDINSDLVVEARPEEIVPQKELQPDISTDITRKLLADLEVRLKEEKTVQKTLIVSKPTSAPSYELVGNGLVYNCKEKHWACIDQQQYKLCRGNYSWNQNEGIPVECYPVAFLETSYDCAIVQQEKIDSVSDTDFCEE